MTNGKYYLGGVIAICGTALSACTGRGDYFSDACLVLMVLGYLYRNR